jgi:hypothetical protein
MYTSSNSGSCSEFKPESENSERPVIIIPDLSNLRHVYNNGQPYILKDYRGCDAKYLNEWREKQKVLYEFIKGYDASNSDIEDPCPYTDSWYIFGLPPFIDKMIQSVILKDKNI